MKRIMAALALSAAAALPAACGREVEEAPAPASGVSAQVAVPPEPGAPVGLPAAPGAPAFAVLYPGASLDEPGISASGPMGPGGLVTYMTDAGPDAVIAFYRAQAEAAGLSSVMAMNQGEARAYGAAGKDGKANLQVVASPTETGTTSVQLSWSAGA
jgi:hypothetical protein